MNSQDFLKTLTAFEQMIKQGLVKRRGYNLISISDPAYYLKPVIKIQDK